MAGFAPSGKSRHCFFTMALGVFLVEICSDFPLLGGGVAMLQPMWR